MKKYTIWDYDNETEYLRIDKRTARSLYNAGVTILFCPVNMSPFNSLFNPSVKINLNDCITSGRYTTDFDKLVNEYEFYNCNNETGKYTAFYRKLSVEESVNSLWH